MSGFQVGLPTGGQRIPYGVVWEIWKLETYPPVEDLGAPLAGKQQAPNR